MEKTLMCPRTEICPVYMAYVDAAGDDTLGIIHASTIENRTYYSCHAFNTVHELAQQGSLAPELTARLENVHNCLLIAEANRSVTKHRADF